MRKEIEEQLILLILKQATAFLEDSGEFYPFGTIVDKNENLIPVGIYDEKEYLPSEEIIEILQKYLIKTIQKEKSLAIALGIDVFITKDEVRKSALLVKISKNGIDWIEKYFAYQLQNNSVIWI